MKLKRKFNSIYKKIKLMFYRSMFNHLSEHEQVLSSAEYFCMECIYLMEKPTISQFANFLCISSPNATYKIKTLIKKGFLSKEKSQQDGREYRLVPTQKFFDYYENKENEELFGNMRKNMTKSENKKMEKILNILTEKI